MQERIFHDDGAVQRPPRQTLWPAGALPQVRQRRRQGGQMPLVWESFRDAAKQRSLSGLWQADVDAGAIAERKESPPFTDRKLKTKCFASPASSARRSSPAPAVLP